MPCGLAVTITKATVANQELLDLLTPEVIKSLVEGFVKQHDIFRDYRDVRVLPYSGGALVRLDNYNYQIFISASQVRANFPTFAQEAGEEMSELFSQLLAKGADRLFAEKVKKSLKKLGQVQSQQATVKNGAQTVPVTILKLEF